MLRLLDEVSSPSIAVTSTVDVPGGVRSVRRQRPDIVLLQLGVPGGSSEEIMDAIDRAAVGTPVILFGDATGESAGFTALHKGAADYLVTDRLNSMALGRVLYYAIVRAGLEARLRDSERRYRALFEHSGMAMLLVERGVVKMVNDRAAKLLGLGSQRINQGVLWSDFLSPEEAQRIGQLAQKHGPDRQLELETHVVTRAGEQKSVVANLVAVPDSDTLIVSLIDLTERLRAQQEVRRQRQYFRALFENSPEGIVAVQADGAVVDINPAFERLFGFKRGALVGRNLIQSTVPLRLHAEARQLMAASLESGSYISRTARMRSDGSEVMVSILGTRIDLGGRRIGAFGIFRDVTAQIAAQERLEEAFIDLVETTVRMMESVDPYTASHQRTVARLADMVGRRLGLGDEQLQGLYIGGLLHDIGKLSLPSTLLSKPGKLSRQEWALIRTHPRRGYEMLLDAKLPWPVADMALRHHERLDGSGYPDGIDGEALSLEVRVLGACDVVEAMSTDRPYRPALPIEMALAELIEGSGSRYDTQVVEALMDAINSGGLPPGSHQQGDG